MARVTAKTQYALLAALDLAEHYDGDKPVKLREIAVRTDVPSNYLVHILLSLKSRALVNSIRGPKGGYWLIRPPRSITVAEVVAAVEPRRPSRRRESGGAQALVDRLLSEADARGWEYLAGLTLEQALQRRGGP